MARKIYTLDDDLMPILTGMVPVPNVEPITEAEMLLFVAYHGTGGKRALLKTGGPISLHGTVWLSRGQDGNLTGEGRAIVRNLDGTVSCFDFSICKHEKVEGPNANHSRGWHPGYCKHCGMNMSVDSGD